MTIEGMKAVVRMIKPHIKYANNHADYHRVQWLKQKKLQIKARIKKLQESSCLAQEKP